MKYFAIAKFSNECIAVLVVLGMSVFSMFVAVNVYLVFTIWNMSSIQDLLNIFIAIGGATIFMYVCMFAGWLYIRKQEQSNDESR